MQRFNKKTMTIEGATYDALLAQELDVWSKYTSGGKSLSDFDEVKSTHSYITYRKGTIEKEIGFIAGLQPNSKALELGSADGWLTNEILKLPNITSVTSIDIALEDNKRKYSDKAYALRGDLNKIEKIPFTTTYDCIITHGTLHHLVDPRKTLRYCVDSLLTKNGLLIINDTWVLQPLQLKLNAALFLVLNKLPHSILQGNLPLALSLLFIKLPKILFNTDYAESIAHAYETSPFESISSADDYKDTYEDPSLEVLYFMQGAALPGLQNSWMSSPVWVKNCIQWLDDFLINHKLLCGDYHICVMRKR